MGEHRDNYKSRFLCCLVVAARTHAMYCPLMIWECPYIISPAVVGKYIIKSCDVTI